MLDEAIAESESFFAIIFLIAKGVVFATRGILWCLMMLAHLATCFLLRQMEFDADRYETYVGGSETFAETTNDLHALQFAEAKVMSGLSRLIKKSVMVDDLPRLTENVMRQVSAKDRQVIEQSITESQTGFFDTHPCANARIEAASRLEQPGLLHIEQPARELFQHYDGLCKNVTQDFYRNAIGRLVDPSEMDPFQRHVYAILDEKD